MWTESDIDTQFNTQLSEISAKITAMSNLKELNRHFNLSDRNVTRAVGNDSKRQDSNNLSNSAGFESGEDS